MCLALLPVCGAAADTQSAGAVKAMIPDASRNAHPLAVNDPLQWNDLLQTDAKGRVRAGLNDGSILSLGSNSQLRIVQHDAAVQQTQIDLTYGKLRNQVTKITQPQGKYQVKTSNAVIGVIGTDFYVDYAKGRTTVICYEGRVFVTPVGDARVMGSTNVPAAPDGSMTLRAGQIVIIGPKISRDETLLYPVLMQQSKNDTDVSASATTAAKPQLDDGQTRTAKGLPTLAGKDDTDVSAPATTAAKPQLDGGQTRTEKGLPVPAAKDDTDVSAPATTAAKPQLDGGQTRTQQGLPALAADPRLTDAAGKHNGLMAENGAHQSSVSAPATTAAKPQLDDETQLVGLINQTRTEKGLPALAVDPRLTDAARKHTELMAENGALTHQFPGELPLQQRIDAENIPTDLEAENVGWDVNVAAAHQSLVEDPPHLRNILDSGCNVVGVAVIRRGNHVFITEDFAHLVPENSQP